MDLFQRELKRLLWYLIGGSRGGFSRANIIRLVRDRPLNTNQIAKELGMDYKTAEYHLRVLVKNNILSSGANYGAQYFLSPMLEQNYAAFEEIWEKVNKTGKG
ncbi:MAG: winged helix-turn-helix transcriptional regulator [Candidatus Aenigmarchaeota archaeon]|nr:winged helix-turn-helix transcriptional regulator [Candidatus Aenigmarchaeota archaeon]